MTGKLKIRDGIYYAVIYYKDSYGKYKQKWISTKLKERGNKKEAQRILDQELEIFKQNLNNPDSSKNNIIFIDYVNQYVESKKFIVSPTTFRGYLNLVKHINNFFGKNLKLKDVTCQHILDFYQHLRTTRNVKNTTIGKYKEIIAPALKQAYRDDLIAKNPYEFMPKLKREKPKRSYYDIEELETLFKITDPTPIGLIVKVASYYGFRRSEILGLRWQSIDFRRKTITIENKVVNVEKEVISSEVLKTLSSNRTLPLLPEIEELLLNRKQEIEKNMMLYGNSYNHKYDDYIFVDDLGNLFLPDYVSHKFRDLLEKNNLKHIRFHDLRHSCASLLVNKNIPMKNIQEWLGHSTYNLTADTYSHLNFETKKESASAISLALSNKTTQEELDEEILKLERLLEEKKKQRKKSDMEM